MKGSNWLRKRTIVYNPLPKSTHKKSLASRVWYVIREALKRTCIVIGAIVLVSVTISVFSTTAILKGQKKLPGQMVLLWPIEGSLSEAPDEPAFDHPLKISLASRQTVRQIINSIDRAKDDNRVKALVVSLRSGGISLSHVEELRRAIKRFRESGKPTVFFTTDFTKGIGSYYLASAFEEIWMQPVGTLMLSGISLEEPYISGMLEKLGISAKFFRREKYKTVYEWVTNSNISSPQKKMMTELVNSLGRSILDGIGNSRDIAPLRLKSYVDMGLLTDDEALEYGFVDRLGYGDILVNELREEITGDPESKDIAFVRISDYGKISPVMAGGSVRENKPEVALIYINGIIMPDDSASSSPMMQGGVASAREISSAIKQASDYENIKAIVLRVNSPGGSPTASETIRWSIDRARLQGKPVYVSMGPVAASGGYWVSAPADRIFASPSTLTGSIGVVSGKLILSEMWKKINVNWEGVSWGEKAGMWSMNSPFSEEESGRVNAMMDAIYSDFIKVVSDGRGMTREKVEEVAGGYVWTGGRALEAGLVDELGGLDKTMDYVAGTMNLADGSDLSVRILPKPKSPAERLLELIGNQLQAGQAMETQAQVLDMLKPLVRKAAVLEHSDEMSVYLPVQAP
jgi:protease-4